MEYLLSILGVGFAFGLVIFVHEFGHFIVAKRSGIKVEQFSFGFGKEIFGFKKGETRYTVNWIPLGGFVKMAGDIPEDYAGPALEKTSEPAPSPETGDHSRDFLAKPWYIRIFVATAGPIMNYVLAIFLFASILLVWGEPVQINKTEIGEVMPGKPAAQVGLQPGDKIKSISGISIDNFYAAAEQIHKQPEKELEIIVIRHDKELSFRVVPEKGPGGIGLIGIRPADSKEEYHSIGLMRATKQSVLVCWNISQLTILYLWEKILARERPDLAGPIGITQVIVKAVKTGMKDFLYLIALISVAIGLFNLFPIPMLDGGHVFYYAVEGIIRRPVSPKIMSRANMVGLVLLLGLFAFATFNDIQRIYLQKFKSVATQPK